MVVTGIYQVLIGQNRLYVKQRELQDVRTSIRAAANLLALFHGAVFVDSDYRNEDSCGGDWDYEMNQGDSDVIWSQCAVDRVIVRTGLDTYAYPSLGGKIRPLPLRAFEEPLR